MAVDNTKSITINDVARLAGVSKRTVSRVLNNSPKVNPKTREKIQQVIAEYDYEPSKQARGLASSRSYLLGLIYDDPNGVVIHSVQKGILAACANHGYEMVVHPTNYQSEELVHKVLDFVRRSKLDGLIIMPPISANQALADALADVGIPYVRLAAKSVDSAERMVISDDRQAMQQVAELFAKAGAKDIAMIEGPQHRLASAERREGIRDALAALDVRLLKKRMLQGDFSYESGVQCAQKLLAAEPIPDAIFAANDQMAIGAIHVAEDMGIKVPEQLLVVGYDDEPMAYRLRPSLTTLQRPNEEMARVAALKLIAAITGNEEMVQDLPTVFAPQLICRQSTNR